MKWFIVLWTSYIFNSYTPKVVTEDHSKRFYILQEAVKFKDSLLLSDNGFFPKYDDLRIDTVYINGIKVIDNNAYIGDTVSLKTAHSLKTTYYRQKRKH